MDIKFKVFVNCMTYNQSGYIGDAMNGFCMQETNFPFVCTIVDDASTDGEQEVIKKYLQEHFDLEDSSIVRNEETDDYVMVYARHKTNLNCFFAVYYLKYNHYKKKSVMPYVQKWHEYAKYIAKCEGDDYWTEPRKLQIQYDYLESHPDIVLSCHRFSILDVTTGQNEIAPNQYFSQKEHCQEKEFEFDVNYFLNVWVTKNLTIMVRKDAIDRDYHKKYKYARDVHFIYYVMQKGNGVCHAFNGGVYRKNVPTSIFGNLNRADKIRINRKVYKELARVTHDPSVRKVARKYFFADWMNRVRGIGDKRNRP